MTAAPLRVRIGPSRRLTGLLVLVHMLGWIVLYPLALWGVLKLALAAVIAVSGVRSVLNTALLRSRRAIIALEPRDEQVAIRERNAEQWQLCRVLPTSFVSPCLTVLNLRPLEGGATRHAVIVPDNVDKEDFRRLRVWLRWGKPAGGNKDRRSGVSGHATRHADR